jgi:hypothetical protein
VIAFLLDQGVPRSAVDHLRAAGHDAIHTSGIGLASADDGRQVKRSNYPLEKWNVLGYRWPVG